MKDDRRSVTDTMGAMLVPAAAYYGAQTARAVENFPISGWRFPRRFIRALGLVKKHAASANRSLELLSAPMAAAIQQAAQEVIDGRLDDQFVVDVFQTGSGTSTNMNANEVIAARAAELAGGGKGDRSIHPNDHVNLGQSSNDVIPTALHVAALEAIQFGLIPALAELRALLQEKAYAFRDVIKLGRTHLQDATPIRLGQEFSGYATQLVYGIERVEAAGYRLSELALGGTAVGTGINTHPEFARRAIAGLAMETGLELREATNHFEAQGARDAVVEMSGALKTVAVSLIKIAGDIRYMGSGPRAGIGEIRLPAVQPGSSIMPGKVNPVMCEMMIQVGAQVIGNDAAITFAGASGHLELNTMLPVMAHNLLQSIELLTNGAREFGRRCVQGLEADEARCAGNIEQSLAMATALVPAIGYEKAAALAKDAHETNRTVRQVALERSDLNKETITRLLDQVGRAGPLGRPRGD